MGRATLFTALLLALFVRDGACFGIAPAGRGAIARPVVQRFSSTMKSQEDKEFEEWVRKKKIASGVDPDEDFGAGRRAEGSIYLVGGARKDGDHFR